MADNMYKTVGKQQKQIDDLRKTTDNHESRINTLETKGMAAPPDTAPQKPAQHKPLPHKHKSRLTPGEIEAIKQMRANPHIPEDAKPDLPEGYE